MGSRLTPQWSQSEHEQALVRAFIVPAKRRRIQELLAIPRRRETVLRTLNHFADFNPRCIHEIPAARHDAAQIAAILRDLKAPETCFVISTRWDLDAHQLPVLDVLNEILAKGDGTILSCIPGVLGYFEGEDPGDRFILRPAIAGEIIKPR